MQAGKTTPQQVTELVIGVAKDLSFAALTGITDDAKQHEFIFLPDTIPALHAHLIDLMRKYPGLSIQP